MKARVHQGFFFLKLYNTLVPGCLSFVESCSRKVFCHFFLFRVIVPLFWPAALLPHATVVHFPSSVPGVCYGTRPQSTTTLQSQHRQYVLCVYFLYGLGRMRQHCVIIQLLRLPSSMETQSGSTPLPGKVRGYVGHRPE